MSSTSVRPWMDILCKRLAFKNRQELFFSLFFFVSSRTFDINIKMNSLTKLKIQLKISSTFSFCIHIVTYFVK